MPCIIHSYDFKLCLLDSFIIEQHMQQKATKLSQNIMDYFLKNNNEFETLSQKGHIFPLVDITPGALQLFWTINSPITIADEWQVTKKYEHQFKLAVTPDSSIWLVSGEHLRDWGFNYSKHHDELSQYIDGKRVCSGKKILLPEGSYSVSFILLHKIIENDQIERALYLQFEQTDIKKICNDIIAFKLKHYEEP